MKLFLPLLAVAGAVSLSACTVAASPTSPSALATVDASMMIEASTTVEGFEPAFYRAFLQNGHEAPDRLEPVRVLQGPLRLYVRTLDDEGRAIDRTTLDTTVAALIDSATIWSGQTFGIAELVRGTRTREKAPGWITVKWSRAASGSCGRSTVGVDGGFIELNVSGACSCGLATAVYPRVVRHELGHAMGYYHTADPTDVMYGRAIQSDTCDLSPSDRERLHARLAHTQSH